MGGLLAFSDSAWHNEVMEGTRIFKQWNARMDADLFTRGQCNQFSAVMHGFDYYGEPRGHKTSLTAEEAGLLYGRLLDKVADTGRGVGLLPDHVASGLKYVDRYFGTTSPVVDFTYVGPSDAGVTAYRAHMEDGSWFDYYAWGWMSSGDMQAGRRISGYSAWGVVTYKGGAR